MNENKEGKKPKEGVCTMVPREPSREDNECAGEPVLSRDQILNVNDVQVQRIEVPEWGGNVYIRTFMAGEWDDFENNLVLVEDGEKKKAAFKDYRAGFAVLVLCDEQGNKLFDKKDITLLTRKSRAALDRILAKGKALNNVSKSDEEELVESLEPTPDGDS